MRVKIEISEGLFLELDQYITVDTLLPEMTRVYDFDDWDNLKLISEITHNETEIEKPAACMIYDHFLENIAAYVEKVFRGKMQEGEVMRAA